MTALTIADLVLQILSFVAENERITIMKRQEQGIAAAKAKGVRFGRPEIEIPEDFDKIVKAFEKREISLDDAVNQCNMSISTFYRRIREKKLVKSK